MTIITLVITLVIVGVALYLITLIPMDQKILRVIQVVVILLVVIWILQQFGLLPGRGISLK